MRDLYIKISLLIVVCTSATVINYNVLKDKDNQIKSLGASMDELKIVSEEKSEVIDSLGLELKDLKTTLVKKEGYIEVLTNKIEKLKKEADNKSVSNALSKKKTRASNRALSLSKDDVELMARLVEAESGAEPYEGKVAVANVILNRVESPKFPNTVKGVIYQEGQFSSTHMLYDRPTGADCYNAVYEALNGVNNIGSCLYFWADYVRPDHPIWSLPVKFKIGGHVFSDAC